MIFLHDDTYSGKLKVTLSYWVDMVKNGHGLSGDGTLKCAVSEE